MTTEYKASVIRLEWGSDNGQAFYREVWSNGVKTRLIFPGIWMNDSRFKIKKEELEAVLIGQRR